VPNTRSAKKRMRQSAERRTRNRGRKSVLKNQIRKFLDALHDKDKARAESEYRAASRTLDRTAAKGTLHKNAAARRKSRLAARLKALTATP